MKIALYVFFSVVAVLCLAAIVLLIVDSVRNKRRNSSSNAEPVEQPVEPTADATTADIAEADTTVATASTTDETPNVEPMEQPEQNVDTVVVTNNQSAVKRITHEERIAELSEQQHDYYEQIVNYVTASDDNIKVVKNSGYEEYRIGRDKVLRIAIKRGLVNCEFTILNPMVSAFISDNKIKAKQAPMVLKIKDDNTLASAKKAIDIAIDGIYKEQIERKARKKNRTAARQQATDTEPSQSDSDNQ